MSDRLCGYCRQLGHRKPDCPDFLGHRNTVLTHTPKQRKALIEGLARLGLGNGALLRVKDYWHLDRVHLCIVNNFNWVEGCSFITERNIKYSKRVRLEERFVESDFISRQIQMSVLKLNGGAEEINVGVPVSRMLMRFQDPNSVPPEEHYFNKIAFSIDAPSYDCDYDPQVLVKDVFMPQRLRVGKEKDAYDAKLTGIMP